MAFAKLSPAQAAAINLARNHGDDATRKNIKREIFEQVKDAHGIPRTHKVKANTTDASDADYLVIKRKTNNGKYELGSDNRWTGSTVKAEVPPPPPPAQRWFKLNNDAITDLLDTARASAQDGDIHHGGDFTDGSEDSALPGGMVNLADDVRMDDQGNVYVQMDEDEFTTAIA